MDQTSAFRDTTAADSTAPLKSKVEAAAMSAHQVTDNIADKATVQVDRLSGTAHRAVNSAADAATFAAEWVSTVPDQAKEVQMRLTESAGAAVRAKPLQAVAGALVVGYLLGRLARL
jgi:ElaB/YqjD/DUF883 family membrane-anchored ribosome-binding protein